MIRNKKNMGAKEKFLASALKLFSENGFENTSTTAICTDAGYSSGAMFFHFKTKNDLLDSLFLSIKQDSAKYILERIGKDLDPDKMIIEIVKHSFDYYLNNYEEFIFMKSFTESKHFARVGNEATIEELKMFFDILEEGKSKGLFVDEDVKLTFIGINAMIYNFVNYIKENGNNSLDRCVDYIMRSILKK